MKKSKYILVVLFLTFRFISFGQQTMDSVQVMDGSSNKINPKEVRKQKDSIAKNLNPISDKAIIYIIRNRILDWLIPYRMDCDSFQVGWFKAGTYLYTILDPGEHVLICTAPTANENRLKANLESGKIYYVEISYGIGIINTVVKMKMMDESKGRKNLLMYNISKHNQYPLFPKSKEVESFPPEDK
jgi:hypothetical protein